jgi:hypothetical protein
MTSIYKIKLLFCLSLVLFSCQEAPVGGQTRSMSNQSDSISDFNHFIKRFSSDSVFQVKHCLFPLKIVSLIDPVDEKHSIDFIERIDFSFINLPIKGNECQKSGYYTEITSLQADRVYMLLRHNNMGIHVEYVFSLQHKEWFLVEVRDEST